MKHENKTAQHQQAGYELWEYLLAAYPDEEVNREISNEKKFFKLTFGEEGSLKDQPHIIIASFLAKEGLEATLLRWIQNICSLQPGFTVSLNNFSGFPPHTIYLRVQDHRPFARLMRQLKIIDGFVQSNDCPPIRMITHPHLTIAGKLPEHIYEKAIQNFAQRSFQASFNVDKLILIKRPPETERFELVNIFSLAPILMTSS